MTDNRIFYSVNEAAKAAGIGLTKLREEIAAERLVARKLGKRTLIKISDLSPQPPCLGLARPSAAGRASELPF
jgi:excisionase family DNA binding protein